MDYQQFKNKTRRANILADVDTLGSFDFYTLIISLDAVSSQDIRHLNSLFQKRNEASKKFSGEEYRAIEKIHPLAVHEYTHFIDATSTLWGFKYLSLMNEAYASGLVDGEGESGFHKAKTFYDYCRNIRLPNYYTTFHKKTADIQPWKIAPTIGHAFDKNGIPSQDPILFMRFANKLGEPVARSPISMISLLEASAMAQELMNHAELLKNTDQDYAIIEQRHFSAKTIKYIYNREITEYSVCAHIVANQQKLSDALSAFSICSPLVRFVLNFPDSAFNKIKDSKKIHETLEIPEGSEYCKRLKNGLENRDRGILFYLIAMSLPENTSENLSRIESILTKIIFEFGADPKEILEMRDNEAKEALSKLLRSRFKHIAKIASSGLSNFKKIGNSVRLDFNSLNIPPVMLNDSTTLPIISISDNNHLIDLSIDECFDELYAGQSWVVNFAEACV